MKLIAQASAGLQGKCTAGVHAVKSSLVANSTAARHRRIAFKPARTIRVAAAAPEDGTVPAARSKVESFPASSLQEGQLFEGTVVSVSSLGAFVDIGPGLQGLVHISQLSNEFVGNVAEVVKVGDKVNVKVLSVDLEKERVSLTMKGLNTRDIEEEEEGDGDDWVIAVGQEYMGTVTSVSDEGAFVTVGSGEKGALVPLSELGDDVVESASDVVSVGDKVTVRVLSYDGETLALTMKAAEVDDVADIIPGAVYQGTVKNLSAFGAFVDIDALGIDGLVHISQLSDGFVEKPSDVVSVGDKVTVRVLSYDGMKLALTMKDAVETGVDINPGDEFEGTVRNITTFGAFVGIDSLGINGLVHISQLPGDAFVQNVSDVLSTGDKVTVRVLSYNGDKLALTMKAAVVEEVLDISPGDMFDGTVTKVESFGAFVNIGIGMDGLVHISQISDEFLSDTSSVNVGDAVKVRVISYDASTGRIALTMKSGGGGGGNQELAMDIEKGDKFEGTVTKVESYGAFVNIGVGMDGLVHISQLGNDYVEDAHAVVSVGQVVRVKVVSFDPEARRIALTMKNVDAEEVDDGRIPATDLVIGQMYTGVVTSVQEFGAFVDIGADKEGLVHVSQFESEGRVEDANTMVQVGQEVKVKMVSYDSEKGRLALTMKSVMTGSESGPPSGFNMDDDAAIAVGRKKEEDKLKEGLIDFMDSVKPWDFEKPTKEFNIIGGDGEIEGEYAALPGYSFVDHENPGDMEDSVESLLFFQMRDDHDLEEFSTEALESLEAIPSSEMESTLIDDIPVDVPVNELVEGKVTAVEADGLRVSFTYNGKELEAYLPGNEAKVPFSMVPTDEQAAYTVAAVPLPAVISEFLAGVIPPEDPTKSFITDMRAGNDIMQTPAEYEAAYIASLAKADAVESEDPNSLPTLPLYPHEYKEQYISALLNYEGAATLLAEIAEPAPTHPEWVGANGRDLTEFYAVGDSITALVLADERVLALGYENENEETEEGEDEGEEEGERKKDILLTMFPDWEVEQNALAARANRIDYDDDEEQPSENPSVEDGFHAMDDDGTDVMGLDPMALLADEMEAYEPGSSAQLYELLSASAAAPRSFALLAASDPDADAKASDIAAADAAEGDAEDSMFSVDAVEVQTLLGSTKKGLFFGGGGMAGMMDSGAGNAFPDRDMDFEEAGIDVNALGSEYQREYFSEGGDVSTLDDFWEDDYVAPTSRAFYQKIRMRVVFDEQGEGELEEYEEASEAAVETVSETAEGDEAVGSGETVSEAAVVAAASEEEEDDFTYLLNPEHDDMVADLVAALLDTQEGESEVALKAMRRPVFHAAAASSISAADVKALRTKTGSGMMDCKKALGECNGNVDAAIDWLRKKGLSGADKKASRIAAEGAIVSYIHPGSRLGVLLEVNCETDFVAASSTFRTLVQSLAMQLAASPSVVYVAMEDIPAEIFEKEKQMEMGREDIKSKPEAIRAKIAEGRAQKLAQEWALMPQPYLVDGSKTVEEAVKEAIAALGEKISVRRFVKFQLGEGLEKKSNDFAAEVAAATGSN